MGLNLHKYINFNNKKLSVKFFNQRLPFIYILFNFFYRLIKVNSKIDDNEMIEFHKFGFKKINISLKNEINEFKDKFFLKTNIDNKKKIPIELNDEDRKKFIIKIKNKLKPIILKLEKYFNCDCLVTDVSMWRNLRHDDKDNLNQEHYANHFHQDSYLMTYSKIHVNLMDISNKDGPLEIIPITKRSNFVKSFKYKDRHDYHPYGDENLIIRNTGKLGDCFLFSSSQLFHRAGVPEKYRDMMQIIIVTTPRKNFKEIIDFNEEELLRNKYSYFQKFTKPYSIIKVIELFFIHLRYKLYG